MLWPAVVRSYMGSFERASATQAAHLRTLFQAKTAAKRPAELPETNLSHLRLMTDDTGLLQHATFNVPRYADGYCLDDNAMALLAMAPIEAAGVEEPNVVRALGTPYL